MAELAESNEDRLQLDGTIVEEQLEGLATIELINPVSSSELEVGLDVSFLDTEADTSDRYQGSITSILSDTRIGLMFDRMAISLQVEADSKTTDPTIPPGDNDTRIVGGHA